MSRATASLTETIHDLLLMGLPVDDVLSAAETARSYIGKGEPTFRVIRSMRNSFTFPTVTK